jgi:hypothetical protein
MLTPYHSPTVLYGLRTSGVEGENCVNLSEVLKVYKKVFRKYGKYVEEIFYVECKVIGGLSKHRLGH